MAERDAALPRTDGRPARAGAQRWQALAPRERQASPIVLALVAVALLWLLAVQPAWRTVRDGAGRDRPLEAQWQQMQRLAAESKAAARRAAGGAGAVGRGAEGRHRAARRAGRA